jgi:ribosomal protein L9
MWQAKAKAKKGGAGKVQVLLKDAVEGVGKANEVVFVASSYFNNFLRPKNLATIISDEEVQEKEAQEQARVSRT